MKKFFFKLLSFLLLTSVSFFSCKKNIAGENELSIVANPVAMQQYFNYTVNGTAFSYTTPADSLNLIGLFETAPFNENKYSVSCNNIPANSSSMTLLDFDKTGITLGSIQNIKRLITPQFVYAVLNTPSITVSITEYGNIGEFIAGNFAGTFMGYLSNGTSTGSSYNVTGNFRVKRTS